MYDTIVDGRNPATVRLLVSTLIFLIQFLGCQGPVEPERPTYLPRQGCCPTWVASDSLLLYYDFGITDSRERGLWLLSLDRQTANPAYLGSMSVKSPDISPAATEIVFESATQIYTASFASGQLNDSTIALVTEGMWNYFPEWSPDGMRIAFENRDCGHAAEPPPDSLCGVMVMDRDGSNVTYLNRGSMPSWSPDGSTLVYAGADGEIETISSGGGSVPKVISDFGGQLGGVTWVSHPRYSPNGDKIAVEVRAANDIAIWLLESSGADPCRVIGGRNPTWSGTGRYIAFERYGDDDPANNWTIWAMDLESGETTQLTHR